MTKQISYTSPAFKQKIQRTLDGTTEFDSAMFTINPQVECPTIDWDFQSAWQRIFTFLDLNPQEKFLGMPIENYLVSLAASQTVWDFDTYIFDIENLPLPQLIIKAVDESKLKNIGNNLADLIYGDALPYLSEKYKSPHLTQAILWLLRGVVWFLHQPDQWELQKYPVHKYAEMIRKLQNLLEEDNPGNDVIEQAIHRLESRQRVYNVHLFPPKVAGEKHASLDLHFKESLSRSWRYFKEACSISDVALRSHLLDLIQCFSDGAYPSHDPASLRIHISK